MHDFHFQTIVFNQAQQCKGHVTWRFSQMHPLCAPITGAGICLGLANHWIHRHAIGRHLALA